MEKRKKSIRVVAAVIRKGDKVFATQRGYGNYKDWWEFPGGKVEEGETPGQALVREIREELTADISVGEYLTTVEYDYPEFHLSMACYWCSVNDGHLVLLEHEAAAWLPLNDLRQVKWLPADVLVIEEIEKLCSGDQAAGDKTAETLRYYEDHADSFIDSTIDVNMEELRSRFLSVLPEEARILDLGCGSGRDAKAFLEQGLWVDAADGSKELCEKASALTGIPVKNMLFNELDAEGIYDGIWACASILHLSKPELSEALTKIRTALKPNGVLYASFKYGTHEGVRNGRYFTDFTEETLQEFWKIIPHLEIFETWITQDMRPDRKEERWINLLARRVR